jgi:hypothetical protein
MKFPAPPRPERALDNIIEADLRPYEARRVELKLFQSRVRSLMAGRLPGSDLPSVANQIGNDVLPEAQEIGAKNKPAASGSLTT